MCERRATVTRVNGEWGKPSIVGARAIVGSTGADIVAMVHGETSTGVRNPVKELAAIAQSTMREMSDAVTSFGAVPLEIGAWGVDVLQCTRRSRRAVGLAPIVFTALEKASPASLDLDLLKDYETPRITTDVVGTSVRALRA
jgi:alanine-glyoxylate transaminase/serine-glyoxylate transaminase/serine-pyruvate transaminase